MLAYQLLHQPSRTSSTRDLRATLIEKRPDIGRGIAYRPPAIPDHLLNVRVANMSALPDQPDHFGAGLTVARSRRPCVRSLLLRATTHLRRLHRELDLEQQTSDPADAERLSIVRGTYVEINEGPAGASADAG